MPKPALSLANRLRRFQRRLKQFSDSIGRLSLFQVVLFLVTPLVLLFYLSLPIPISRPAISPLPTPTPKVILSISHPLSLGLPTPSVAAKQIFIMDESSKTVLLQIDALAQVYPASTTKMMTALVALDAYPLDRIITVTTAYPDGQNIGLVPGETITVEQLLYATLIQSANDAAEVLAENFVGGRSAFVSAMNAKAKALHLDGTHFLNPTGLDEEGHYSSAVDLVRLADFALNNPEFAKIVATENSVITTNLPKAHVLANVNQLLGKLAGVKGVKSGQTDKSGQSLVTLVDRNNHPVLLAVLGSTDRFADTKLLIDWVFANFRWAGPDTSDPQH